MTDSERVQQVEKAIREGTDYSMTNRLELVSEFKSKKEFENYILVLMVLIERSKWSETASSLLLRKVYKDNIYKEKLSLSEYGDLFLTTVTDKAITPYVGISTALRRLISSIIYNKSDFEIQNIESLTSKEMLLKTNVYLLSRYLQANTITDEALRIYYNCVFDIHPESSQITLSQEASKLVLDRILAGGFADYLKLFVRPMYTSHSSNFPGSDHYVPEPFFRQIFNGVEGFVIHLNEVAEQNPKEKIFMEIKKFMDFFQKNVAKNSEFVVNGKDINLDKELHINARL